MEIGPPFSILIYCEALSHRVGFEMHYLHCTTEKLRLNASFSGSHAQEVRLACLLGAHM